MNVRKLVLPFALVPLFLAACGDEGGGAGLDGNLLPVDPAYFATQQFECAAPGEFPSCPPSFCQVDINGNVQKGACENACNTSSGDFYYCTAFEGPTGIDICVPTWCDVTADGTTQCLDDCAEDDVTCYGMELFETTCS